MKRLTWKYEGMSQMGDANGPIRLSTATVSGHIITKRTYVTGRPSYEARGCKVMASDVRMSLQRNDNVSISALNYGLGSASVADVAAELRRMLPGVKVSAGGFMGYIQFVKEATDDQME